MATLNSFAPGLGAGADVTIAVSSGFTNGDAVTGCAPRRPTVMEMNPEGRPNQADTGRFVATSFAPVPFTAQAAWSAPLISGETTLDTAATAWFR